MATLDVTAKRARLLQTFHLSPGPLGDALSAGIPAAEKALAGLTRRDAATWSRQPDVQRLIANRLGWLTSPAVMAEALPRLEAFASSIRRDGFTDVLLLGMGGSSLAPEVLRAVLGVQPGWPRFHMLDSTDPAAVRAAATTPKDTLYLLSSKSGTTIEPNVLAAHFRQGLEDAGVSKWADHFVAITDAGTALAARAQAEGFRDVFINPSDIGGRYSALSFFGLVPAALMGLDVAAIVGWGLAMIAACEAGPGDVTTSPGAGLGLAMGTAARAGRDKLTFLLPPELEAFGLWLEQLIAESTGKNGVGIVPIAGEPSDSPIDGGDRFFVRIGAGVAQAPTGAPSADIDFLEPSAIGAEFVRWEIATAVAGAILQINPFDEPNVQQAKDATRTLLDRYKTDGLLPAAAPDLMDGDVALTLSTAAREQLGGQDPRDLLTLIGPGDYCGLLAYLGPDADLAKELRRFRLAVRDRTRAATMFGYGPRYLHSTGQLHKGGPNTGVFVLISAAPREDVSIPGEPFSFGTLEFAQALGDFASLDATCRRALHVHLPQPDAQLIHRLADALIESLSRSG
jgi:transaldolase/glucose-6-phosphate isomerase